MSRPTRGRALLERAIIATTAGWMALLGSAVALNSGWLLVAGLFTAIGGMVLVIIWENCYG